MLVAVEEMAVNLLVKPASAIISPPLHHGYTTTGGLRTGGIEELTFEYFGGQEVGRADQERLLGVASHRAGAVHQHIHKPERGAGCHQDSLSTAVHTHPHKVIFFLTTTKKNSQPNLLPQPIPLTRPPRNLATDVPVPHLTGIMQRMPNHRVAVDRERGRIQDYCGGICDL